MESVLHAEPRTVPAPEHTRTLNPLGVRGIDHIEFYVDNANAWADYYVKRYGMYLRAIGKPETGLSNRISHVVGQGRVVFVFTQAEGEGAIADEIRAHFAKHGCGVRDVAFRVRDAKVALENAFAAGARQARALSGSDGYRSSAIHVYGDTIHSFIERGSHGSFAPGYENVVGGIEDGDISFAMFDHVVANVENMNEWVEFYARVFGFDQTAHFDINTGRSALMSKVVG